MQKPDNCVLGKSAWRLLTLSLLSYYNASFKDLRYSLSHQQRVNASIVRDLSSFARNRKVGQPFQLRICQLSKLSQYTEHCSLFARHLINEISEILNKYRRHHYYFITMIMKTSPFSQWYPSELSFSDHSQINHSKNKLNSSLPCIHCSLSPCGIDRSIWVVLETSCSISLLPI